MTTGFVQRWKGKQAIPYGGLWQSGIQSVAVFTNAGAPTNGTSGTGVNAAGPGALLVDVTNKTLYQNANTAASPTWTQLSPSLAPAGGIKVGTFIDLSVATGLTAAGSTAAGALALGSTEINVVATAAAGTGVALVSVAGIGIGGRQIVYNDGSSTIKVYALDGSLIDAAAGSTGVSLSATHRAEYRVVGSSAIKSALLGATSS